MSTREKYLVTSATGNTGLQVAHQLLDNGGDVRVMSRTNNPIINSLRERGAEVFVGKLNNRQDMQKAINGVKRVYYCYPIVPGLIDSTRMFAEVAQDAKVEAVVNLGQYLSELDDHPSKQTKEHKLGYDVLDQANIGASHVIPGWFADNAMTTALFTSQLGLLPFPLGKGQSPVVANEDIAAVAVSILQDPGGHEGKRYQPTGPKSLSMQDMMDICANITGRKVNAMPMPNFMFKKAIMQMGFHPYLLSQLQLYIKDFQNNVFNYAPTDVVNKFTGRDAENFETTARRYFERGDLMKRTFQGQLQAVKQFMQIGFTPAPSNAKLVAMNS